MSSIDSQHHQTRSIERCTILSGVASLWIVEQNPPHVLTLNARESLLQSTTEITFSASRIDKICENISDKFLVKF